MLVRVQCQAAGVKAWRGARGSADMMVGKAALVLSVTEEGGEYPSVVVEISGTPDELGDLKRKLVEALDSLIW